MRKVEISRWPEEAATQYDMAYSVDAPAWLRSERNGRPVFCLGAKELLTLRNDIDQLLSHKPSYPREVD